MSADFHLHQIYSPSHALLKEYWFDGTFRDRWPQTVHHCHDLLGNGDFLSDSYHLLLRRRLDLIVQSVGDLSGEIVVWSDVDIQWFCSVEAELRMLMADADFLYQRESMDGCRVNAGLLVLRAVPRAHALLMEWRQQYAAEGYQRLDQEVLTGIVQSANASWIRPLPLQYWSPVLCAMPEALVCHHAINTLPKNGLTSVQLKYEQLMSVRLAYAGMQSQPRDELVQNMATHVKMLAGKG